jgi:hypothetical protein
MRLLISARLRKAKLCMRLREINASRWTHGAKYVDVLNSKSVANARCPALVVNQATVLVQATRYSNLPYLRVG